jgi:hypothetical protein
MLAHKTLQRIVFGSRLPSIATGLAECRQEILELLPESCRAKAVVLPYDKVIRDIQPPLEWFADRVIDGTTRIWELEEE